MSPNPRFNGISDVDIVTMIKEVIANYDPRDKEWLVDAIQELIRRKEREDAQRSGH